jgi:hypothetical protein
MLVHSESGPTGVDRHVARLSKSVSAKRVIEGFTQMLVHSESGPTCRPTFQVGKREASD